jgi:hypothetical protein
MSYTIQKLPDEPIVVAISHADFSGAEGADMMDELYATLDAQTEHVYLVSDMSAVNLSVDDMLQGASLVTRGQKPVLLHPNITETIIVATSAFIRLATKGLASPIFGSQHIQVIENLDAALAYCREGVAGD